MPVTQRDQIVAVRGQIDQRQAALERRFSIGRGLQPRDEAAQVGITGEVARQQHQRVIVIESEIDAEN